MTWQAPYWRRASTLVRPAAVCRFSGCSEPRAREVEWKGLRFDLCAAHADRLEANR